MQTFRILPNLESPSKENGAKELVEVEGPRKSEERCAALRHVTNAYRKARVHVHAIFQMILRCVTAGVNSVSAKGPED